MVFVYARLVYYTTAERKLDTELEKAGHSRGYLNMLDNYTCVQSLMNNRCLETYEMVNFSFILRMPHRIHMFRSDHDKHSSMCNVAQYDKRKLKTFKLIDLLKSLKL